MPAFLKIAGTVSLAVCLFCACAAAQSTAPKLELVYQKNLPCHILSDQSIYVEQNRVYLACYEGTLYVLTRDAGYPVFQVFQDSVLPLHAVMADYENVYTTSFDGSVRVYRRQDYGYIKLVATYQLANYILTDIGLFWPSAYFAMGQVNMTVDQQHVYLSQLNPGDMVNGYDQGRLARVYGTDFAPGVIRVFDRPSGNLVTAIPRPGGGVSLYSQWGKLFVCTPGCCGAGIYVYDCATGVFERFISDPWTNTVGRLIVGPYDIVVAGTEAGTVEAFDFGRAGLLVDRIDLKTVTGFNGGDDIEIRSVQVDDWQDMVFAGSSHNNPNAPSFFVFRLVQR